MSCSLFASEHTDDNLEYLQKQANAYYEAGLYREAIDASSKVVQIMYESYGLSNPVITSYYFMAGECYERLGKYQDAITCYNNLAICYSYLYENTDDKDAEYNYTYGYAIALGCMSRCYTDIGGYSKAVELKEEAVNLKLMLFGENHGTYLDEYYELGKIYLEADRPTDALEVLKYCLGKYENLGGNNSLQIYELYNCLGVAEQSLQHYDKAIEYLEQGISILTKTVEQNDFRFVAVYSNLGMIYQTIGLYEQAFLKYEAAKNVCQAHSEEWDAESLRQLSALLFNIGNLYRNIGSLHEALEYYESSLQVKHALYGETHKSIAWVYRQMAYCYLDLNDYTTHKKYLQKYRDIICKLYDESSPVYASAIIVTDVYDSEIDTPEQKIEEYKQLSQILLNSYGEECDEYRICLYALGRFNYMLGNYDETLRYYTMAADLFKRIYGSEHPRYAEVLVKNGEYYASIKDLKKAKEYYAKAVDIRYNEYGILHPKYYETLRLLHNCNYALGDMKACKESVVELAYIAENLMLNALTYLTIDEINMYWDLYEYIFRGNLPYYAYHFPNDEELLRATYHCSLLSKGFLLNAERGLRRMIMESGDQEILALYDKLSVKKQQLDYQYNLEVSMRTDSVEQLEEEVRELSNELQSKCSDFSEYLHNINITGSDVKAQLKKSDAAIEFISLDIDDDHKEYCALVLKYNYHTPSLVKLCSQKALDELKAKYENVDGMIYSDPELYNLIWKPLEKELQGVNNVYFSPIDDLYQIAIEYATDGKQMISSHKQLYRLSSTRQLAVINNNQKNYRSVVFGGLDYDAALDTSVALNTNSKDSKSRYNSDVDVEHLNIRGAIGKNKGVKHLSGTEIEANEVSQMLTGAGIHNTLFVGDKGTETAFKDLSGQSINIIHIATHGFYWEGTQKTSDEDDAKEKNYFKEDPSMQLSGLLFSGFNQTLLHSNEKIEGVDDGILTAAEISRMDLSDTNLVVLSACQTGLGRISGDGVFGLQRGFKKAGVNTIVMSLWEVDDIATQLLMRYFYDNISKGMSPTNALALAQNMLKSYPDCDYSSPFYWAGFIIVDGVN